MGRKSVALLILAASSLSVAGLASSDDQTDAKQSAFKECRAQGYSYLSACLKVYMNDDSVVAADMGNHLDVEFTTRPLTIDLSKNEYLRDVKFYIPRLFDVFKGADKINFTMFAQMRTVQGNDVTIRAISTTISRKKSLSTNWQNVDIKKIPAFADDYWQAPSYR
ncbi:hypothetical protein FB480_103430 [Agrobacterium vitis]|nr:hypothetical protein FB480_103430 [Agrobacterium vitis]